jgi:hypothetical protein
MYHRLRRDAALGGRSAGSGADGRNTKRAWPLVGLLSDLRNFFLHRPRVPTLIDASSPEGREQYTWRIAQRLGISVSEYTVLNIHRIGVRAPVRYVFEKLREWTPDPDAWPNHLATLEGVDADRNHLKILFLGKLTRWLRRTLLPSDFGTLFRLAALRIRSDPQPSDRDNARYVLYECSGGYPIGIFAIYVRSPISDLDERSPSQLFFCVSFNFWGRRSWPLVRTLGRVWEAIHNRATSNILNRFKTRCESDFRDLTESD